VNKSEGFFGDGILMTLDDTASTISSFSNSSPKSGLIRATILTLIASPSSIFDYCSSRLFFFQCFFNRETFVW